jgi:hypothetical protein
MERFDLKKLNKVEGKSSIMLKSQIQFNLKLDKNCDVNILNYYK